jgi:hypothetical protein
MSSIATTPLMPPRKINDSKHWRDRARLGYAALGPAGKHSNFKLLRAVRYDGRARAKTFDRTNAFGRRKRWNAKTLRSPRGIENDGWVGSTTLASRARVGCYNCRCVAVLLCSRSTASGRIEELNVCLVHGHYIRLSLSATFGLPSQSRQAGDLHCVHVGHCWSIVDHRPKSKLEAITP